MALDLPGSNHTFRVSQEHLSLALDQVSLGFWEVNLVEGNFMACTDQCKLNFGWDIGKSFSYEDMLSCILPEDLPAMQEKVAHAIREQAPYFAQYRIRHPDNSVHWIEAQGKVFYSDGAPRKIIGTTVDITEKKDLEILRDELLSVTMHELKTPLSAVKSSLQILYRHLEKQGDEAVRRITSRALGSTDRISRLLNDMAEPVLVQAKEIILLKTDFDLRKLADEITENASMLYAGHQLLVCGAEEALIVHADRYRVGQVITNLVNNAIKYSPGEAKVNISLIKDAGEITVRVQDHGIGIPAEERQKVFQKFYRSDARISVDGLGIGLFLCAEIVLRHGGKIGIADTDEAGTTVYFSLPA